MSSRRRPSLAIFQLPAQDGQWAKLAAYVYHLDHNGALDYAHEVHRRINQTMRQSRRLRAESRELRERYALARGALAAAAQSERRIAALAV